MIENLRKGGKLLLRKVHVWLTECSYNQETVSREVCWTCPAGVHGRCSPGYIYILISLLSEGCGGSMEVL